MTSTELYRYRRARNLCVACGDKTDGTARCAFCGKKQRMQARERFANMTKEELMAYKEHQKVYQAEYRRTRLTKEAKAESNRRYREKNPTCTFANKERWLRYNGENVRLGDLARRVGIPYGRMYNRLFIQGLSLSEAIIRG